MIAQIIFSIATIVVLFITTQLVKKFANGFYKKISKFIPLIIALAAIIAQAVFNFITIKSGTFWARIDIVNAVKFGMFIASSEVYTYEGIYKLIRSAIDFLHKTENAVKEVEEATK